MRRLTIRVGVALTALLLAGAVRPSLWSATPFVVQDASGQSLATRLSDADFWALIGEISEPGGYFRITDNFTSNEREIGPPDHAPRSTRERRSLPRRRTGAELHVHCGHPSSHGVHRRHPAAGGGAAPDVQGHLRNGGGPGRFHCHCCSRSRAPPDSMRAPDSEDLGGVHIRSRPIPPPAGARMRVSSRLLTKTHGFRFTADESSQLESVFDAFQVVRSVHHDAWRRAADRRQQLDFCRPHGTRDRRRRRAAELSLDRRQLPVRQDASGEEPGRAGERRLRRPEDHSRDWRLFARAARDSERLLRLERGTVSLPGRQAEGVLRQREALPITPESVFIRPYSMRGGPARPLCPIGSFLQAFAAGHIYSNSQALACTQ